MPSQSDSLISDLPDRHCPTLGKKVAPYGLLTLVGAVGLVICFAGWQGMYNPFSVDQLANRRNARALLDSGQLPVTSGLSSLGAYNPPGSSWYYVPSVFFEDPSLGERFSGFLLYVLTIIPLFLIGRRVGGLPVALLLVLLYTLSAVGIYFEQNLQYRARPFSYAWLLFFMLAWLETGRGRFLFGALVSLGIGLLIFIEMAPIVVGMAVAYWKYRPRIRPAPVLAAAAIVLLLWAPYLKLQLDRRFVDIRASVTQTDIGPEKFSTLRSYGDSLGTWSGPAQLGPFTPPKDPSETRSRSGIWKRILTRAFWAAPNFVTNFSASHYLGAIPIVLTVLLIVLAGHHLYGVPGPTRQTPLVLTLSVLLVVCAIVANEITVSMIVGRGLRGGERWFVRLMQVGMIAFVIGILARRRLSEFLKRMTARLGFRGTPRVFPDHLRIVAYVVLPTWLAFSIVAGAARNVRGFWVLQWLLVGLLLLYCPRYYRLSGWLRSGALVLAFVLVIPNRALLDNLRVWQEHGYEGQKHEILLAADTIARLSRSAGLESPRVGYFLSFNGTELTFALIDDRYGGIGSSVSQYLEIRHGISAADQPPEGFSSQDDFRIVQLKRHHSHKYHRFFLTDREKFEAVDRWGAFELLARAGESNK